MWFYQVLPGWLNTYRDICCHSSMSFHNISGKILFKHIYASFHRGSCKKITILKDFTNITMQICHKVKWIIIIREIIIIHITMKTLMLSNINRQLALQYFERRCSSALWQKLFLGIFVQGWTGKKVGTIQVCCRIFVLWVDGGRPPGHGIERDDGWSMKIVVMST